MTANPVIVTRSKRDINPIEKKFGFEPGFSKATGPELAFKKLAWEEFKKLSFPSHTDEAWRRTDLRPLDVAKLRLFERGTDKVAPIPQSLLLPVTDAVHGGELILSPDGVKASLEKGLVDKGVIFTDFKTAWQKNTDLLEKAAGKLVRPSEDKFAALACAMAETGVLLYVPKNVKVEAPLHSLLWTSGSQIASFSHILVYLEPGAEVTYVHESASANGEGGQSLHSGLMEIYVGEGASLRFVELQSWGDNIWNFTHERVQVAREGNVEWIFGALGSHLTKNFSDLTLNGEGSTGKMSGFYFTDGDQHLDHDTQQNHLAPHTTSDLLFKGALVGQSHSVWQGMIYVAGNASKTDGYQANRNLILDRRARADSLPGLEILTDDVRCTHGATVGKINPEEIFYLESRGMPRSDAERLIVEGFFDPIMQRIPFEGVRQRFQNAILDKMKDYHSEAANL
ncbi:MAG: Fe-S cluster assembly protein SufD [Anaerolineaceae bacterium]|nr:Fe-S cluster assembly protein SufD [Anaerolineaceae bacterium]